MDDGGEVEHFAGALFGGLVDEEGLLVVVGHGFGGIGNDEHEDGRFEGNKGDCYAFGLRRVYCRLHSCELIIFSFKSRSKPSFDIIKSKLLCIIIGIG